MRERLIQVWDHLTAPSTLSRGQQLHIAFAVALAVVIGAVVGLPTILLALGTLMVLAAVATGAVILYNWAEGEKNQ